LGIGATSYLPPLKQTGLRAHRSLDQHGARLIILSSNQGSTFSFETIFVLLLLLLLLACGCCPRLGGKREDTSGTSFGGSIDSGIVQKRWFDQSWPQHSSGFAARGLVAFTNEDRKQLHDSKYP
jgi:hypothetical protein